MRDFNIQMNVFYIQALAKQVHTMLIKPLTDRPLCLDFAVYQRFLMGASIPGAGEMRGWDGSKLT